MALRISRRLWTRGRPLCSGVGRCPSRYAHSASERSVRYGFLMCLMHARVATQIPDYPFSDSFMTEFSEVRVLGVSRKFARKVLKTIHFGGCTAPRDAVTLGATTPLGKGGELDEGNGPGRLRPTRCPRTQGHRHPRDRRR